MPPTLSPSFRLLPSSSPRQRWLALGISGSGQVVALTLLVILAVTHPDAVQGPLHAAETLELALAPAPPKPAAVRHLPKPEPLPPEPQVELHRMAVLLPPPSPEKPATVKRPLVAPAAPQLAPTAAPEVPLQQETLKLRAPVKMDSFATDAAATLKLPGVSVQTGGFGQPDAVAATTHAATGNVAPTGSFDLPDGAGQGNGTHGATGARGVVASGFGDSTAGAPAKPGVHGAVSAAGFGSMAAAQPAAHAGLTQDAGFSATEPAAAVSAPRTVVVTTPVTILSKPNPVYTAEARALHLEGDVVLRVKFGVGGQVEVVNVVQGLGHGLDEAAIAAAEKIKFQPATRAGTPVETEALLRVTFQIADQ